MIDVLLVDDHEIVRYGVGRVLGEQPGINVYAQVDSGEAAIEAVRERRPDVVLMDVQMPGIGGLETTRRLVRIEPELRIIILSALEGDPVPNQMLKAGALGYLTKDCSVDEMVLAINQVHGGDHYITPKVAQAMAVSKSAGEGGSPFDEVSQREMQVMMMIIRGDKMSDISEKLHLSPKTVSTYRNRLYSKLGVRNDAELTRLAMRYGLLDGMD